MKYEGDIKTLKGVAGIYKILCLATGKFYIGSTWSLAKRFKEHLRDLQANRHRSAYMQHSWNKYGSTEFVFSVVEKCPKKDLMSREQFYLDELRPFLKENGFNKSPTAHSILGFKKTRKSVQLQIDTMAKNATDKHILSPDGTLFSFKLIKTFAKEQGISPNCLASVLKGDIRYTGNGWRLPGAPIPEYRFFNPEKHLVTVRCMTLVKFCKENKLSYNCMRKVASGEFLAHKGWTHADRGDLFIDLIGPNEQEASVCKESFAWFWKKYGINGSNFGAMLSDRADSASGWRKKETAAAIKNYYQAKSPTGDIVSIGKYDWKQFAMDRGLKEKSFYRLLVGGQLEHRGYVSLHHVSKAKVKIENQLAA